MSRQPLRFTQADVTRAAKGAIAAGLHVARIEIGPEGQIVIHTGVPDQGQVADELEAWRASQGRRKEIVF